MQPRQCAGCGAPLPHTDTDGVIACRFCGLAHDAHHGVHVARLVIRGASGASRTAAWAVTAVGVLIATVVGVVGLGIGVAVWRASRRPALVTAPAAVASRASDDRVAPADLPNLAGGRHPLDAAPPSSGYGAVDAVTLLPWALSLAQRWAPDAALERIDVERLRPDGTVNAADDAEAVVRYRFVSPEREAQLRMRARTTARAEAVTELHLGIAHGVPYVQGIERSAAGARDGRRAPHPDVPALGALLPRVAEHESYRAPFLNGYLIHLADEGWVWYFGTLDGRSLSRVRATDGEPWPYRRPGTRPRRAGRSR